MIYPQQDPKEVPLSKQMGYYRGPGFDEVAEREIVDLKLQLEKAEQAIKILRAEIKNLRARTGALLLFGFVLLGVFGVWLAAITYRIVVHS